MKPRPVLLICLTAVIVACNSAEMRPGKNADPDAIYAEYRISAQEEDENVSCIFQFKSGGPNGSTILLNEPGKIELDGEMVPADSARFAGIYYEVVKPINAFTGKHSIVFTASNKKQYREDFEFIPFKLANELSPTIK